MFLHHVLKLSFVLGDLGARLELWNLVSVDILLDGITLHDTSIPRSLELTLHELSSVSV